jgi:hypothetical protein
LDIFNKGMVMLDRTAIVGLMLLACGLLAACNKQSAGPVLAPDSPSAIQAEVVQADQNFQYCDVNQDCLLMPDACDNPTSINKEKVAAFENHLAQIKVKCPASQHVDHSFNAKCLVNRCTAVAIDALNAEKPDFYACKEDAECVVTAGLCSNITAVNKAHLKSFEENVALESRAVSCAPPGLPPGPNDKVPTFAAKCTELRCKALLN